jgi:phage baseplate assembly protein V
MTIPRTLPEQIADVYRRLGEIERRNRNRKRTGTVTEVDYKKGLARVQFSKQGGKPFLGPWMPWKEVAAGGIKSHIPPTVGEQVDVVSESGDLTDGVIDMSTPSNANPRPHDGPEAVITKGNSRVTIGDDAFDFKTNNVNVQTDATNLKSPTISIEGDIRLKGNLFVEGNTALTGGAISHNGKNIGHDHRHEDVEPGVSLSGPPV